MGGITINQRTSQCRSVFTKGENVVTKYNHFILALLLVKLHQKLTRHKLVWIHAVQHLLFVCIVGIAVLPEKLSRHRTPDFNTLHVGDVTIALQIKPVRFV